MFIWCKVIFKLHETVVEPVREVSSPPFQIKGSGYGGFPIQIHLFFKTTEKRLREVRLRGNSMLRMVMAGFWGGRGGD